MDFPVAWMCWVVECMNTVGFLGGIPLRSMSPLSTSTCTVWIHLVYCAVSFGNMWLSGVPEITHMWTLCLWIGIPVQSWWVESLLLAWILQLGPWSTVPYLVRPDTKVQWEKNKYFEYLSFQWHMHHAQVLSGFIVRVSFRNMRLSGMVPLILAGMGITNMWLFQTSNHRYSHGGPNHCCYWWLLQVGPWSI